MLQSTQKQIIYFLGILNFLFLAFLINRYSVNMPYWDQWDTPGNIIYNSDYTFKQWFAQHNESRMIFPKLYFVGLANLTNWNTKIEMGFTFFSVCAIANNFFWLGKKTFPNSDRYLIPFCFTSLLLFNPIQHTNWLAGFQIVMTIPMLIISSCLLILTSKIKWNYKITISVFASFFATFSFANGILTWIVLAPALLFQAIKYKANFLKLSSIWIVSFLITTIIYFFDFKSKSEVTLSNLISNFSLLVKYWLTLLGNVFFIGDLDKSFDAGLLTIAIFTIVSLIFYLNKKNKILIDRALPWFIINLYSVLSLVLISLGRHEFGIESSQAPRYIHFSNYFIISLIYLIPLNLEFKLIDCKVNKIITLILSAVFLIFWFATFDAGVYFVQDNFYRKSYGKACLLTVNLNYDYSCIEENTYPKFWKALNKIEKIDDLNYFTPKIVEKINYDQIQNLEGNIEIFENKQKIITKNESRLPQSAKLNYKYNVSGWIENDKDLNFDSVILTYKDSKQKNKLLSIIPIRLIAELPNRNFINFWNRSKLPWKREFYYYDNIPKSLTLYLWGFNTNNNTAYLITEKQIQV